MIVLDTNVVSELMRAVSAPQVLAWLQRNADQDLVTTAVTAAEIQYGIARLPSRRRRADLAAAAAEIFAAFPDQVLPFDLAAAHAYADIVAHRDSLGTPIEGFDAQIAAICRTRAAILATRNEKDFTDTGISITNPWQPDPP